MKPSDESTMASPVPISPTVLVAIAAVVVITSAGQIVGELRASHAGWENLASAFETGMNDWQRRRGVSNPAELGRVQRNLPVLRGQIWPQIRWDVALPEGD